MNDEMYLFAGPVKGNASGDKLPENKTHLLGSFMSEAVRGRVFSISE